MMLFRRLIKSKNFLILLIMLFLIGCATATPYSQQAFEDSQGRLIAKNSDMTSEIVGVRAASEGWLEYRVRVKNDSNAQLSKLELKLTDGTNNEYKNATTSTQLEEPPPLLEGSLFVAGAAVGTGAVLITTGIAIPFLAPVLMGGAFFAHHQRKEAWGEDLEYFARESMYGVSISINDSLEGSFYMPAVEPSGFSIGYTKNDRREWVAFGNSGASGSASHQSSPPVTQSEPKLIEKADIQFAQQRLNQLGYNAGPADGFMGPRTSSALKAYQAKKALTLSGNLDSETLDALRSETVPTGQVLESELVPEPVAPGSQERSQDVAGSAADG